MAIERTFHDIPEGTLDEADQQSFLVSLGWSKAVGWDDLLRSKRILIVSEAGAGKTHECRAQQKRLWDTGEPAFYVDLATFAAKGLRSCMGPEEEERLDAWLTSQSDMATFFLDSIDELTLSKESFEQALKQLSKAIAGQLGRARFVITTRPIPYDEEVVRRLLPLPPELAETVADGETFAKIIMQNGDNSHKPDQRDTPDDWRTVALMPLSDAQIIEFARSQLVDNPPALLDDLQRRNAQEFARRPQDLIERCADWRVSMHIRKHQDQVASNIRIKLKPSEKRPEPAELSYEKALEGASRLALAMMVTRRLTLRHNAEADVNGEGAALDPAFILSDWNDNERKALLTRPLFGFASYGRVRFHHRSVAEYLAAERLQSLRESGKMTARALKLLIFVEARGKIIVRPSKRPIAGWLALSDKTIFEMLRDNDPSVLFNEGDPESLTVSQRTQALRAYVERYSQGDWRGLNVPFIQIHRFASPELAPEINRIWAQGIENPEIRVILLQLIERGQIAGCSDIAHAVTIDTGASYIERLTALEALAALGDSRLEEITADIAGNSVLWPDDLAREVVIRLFPRHLTIARLCEILNCIEVKKRSIGDLEWQLSRLIAQADIDTSMLEALRDGLYKLASTGLRWQQHYPHIVSDRAYLGNALAATCLRGLRTTGVSADWLRACTLAVRLPHSENRKEEAFTELKQMLAELPADQNAVLFWAADALIQSLHPNNDPWKRYTEAVLHGPVQLNSTRDWGWIKAALADTACPQADRAMLMEAAIQLFTSREEWRDHVAGIKPLVADQPALLATIEERLRPLQYDKELKQWEEQMAKRKEQHERKEKKDYASWVMFWREVAERPDTVFSPERNGNTAWGLWHAMSQTGDGSRASGWNRRFIETTFSKEIADRLRLTLMQQWRNEHPTLASERPEDAKGTFRSWQLGLAGVYAEAEDPSWTTGLLDDEARLAVRYVPIAFNGLPLWLDTLITTHPVAVDSILGEELSHELASHAGANWHSRLLQNIGYASNTVASAFIPRLRAWFDAHGDRINPGESQEGAVQRLERVVDVLIKRGDPETRAHLRAVAEQRLRENTHSSFTRVWLPTLMRLDASAGVDTLERLCAAIEPAKNSEAVIWFSTLFGDRRDNINLADPGFTPSILLRLLRLSYQHVRPADDNVHESSYTPNERDYAERGRNDIINALLRARGEEGWAAKLEMAADPLCAHFKDRILAVAEERQAEELDAEVYDDAQAVELDKKGEASPSSNEAMFAIMVDRLDDIDDFLVHDTSSRELWAGINDEKLMRRAIARELDLSANGIYKIDQESVTAEEKETDIRLCSTVSDHVAVIELKLGNMDRSARELRDTLKDQLVKKYMAPEMRRSGCLMITLAKERQWKHPDTGIRIGFEDLIQLLKDEATQLEQSIGGLRLHVHALDLRPRLPTEAKSKKRVGIKKPIGDVDLAVNAAHLPE